MEQPRRLTADEIRVGSLVGLWNGSQIQPAEVIEDRGNVGMGGRRIFRVRVASAGADGLEFEAPLDALVDPTMPKSPSRRSGMPRKRTVNTA